MKKCPRCKVKQEGINECEVCGLVFEQKNVKLSKYRSQVICKSCGEIISSSAKKCPKCGKPLRKPLIKWIVIVIFILLGISIINNAIIELKKTTHKPENIMKKVSKEPKRKLPTKSAIDPEVKIQIAQFVDDLVRSSRPIIGLYYMELGSLSHIHFEVDVSQLGSNPKMVAEQMGDKISSAAVRRFGRDFCIYFIYGDGKYLSRSCKTH